MKNFLRNLSLFLVFFTSVSVFAQTHSITGKVTDSKGDVIPGVNVVIKGTTIGTITNFDGQFQLNIDQSEEAVLVFSFIGYETQEVNVEGQQVINVKLIDSSELIADVVVVGFGQQKKASVVGSIVQAKGEELLQAGSVTTVSEALAGILPGVSIMQAAGQPGATDADILIRGQASWVDNTPLYVVDGVERDFNDLDPNEIESVSVLKDASATAVFGLKAANGVILITTKRGRTGAPVVSVNANWSLKVPTVEYDYITDYSRILEYYNVAAMNDYRYDLMRPQSLIDTWRDPNRDMDFYTYTFWPNYLIDKGRSEQYNINVSGGDDFVKYFTSFGYNYDGDIFDFEKLNDFDPRTYQKRYNWRSNLDFQLTKSTKLSVNLSGDFKDWNGNKVSNAAKTGLGSEVPAGQGQHFNGLFAGFQVGPPPVYSDGRLGIEGDTSSGETLYGRMQYGGSNQKRSTRIYSDFILEQQIADGLVFSGKMSFNYYRNYSSSIYVAKKLYYFPNYIDGTFEQKGDQDAVESLPVYSEEKIKGYDKSTYYDLRLSYTKTFNEVHDIHVMGLFSRRNFIKEVNFPIREESWVGRMTYGYNNKYLVEFNGAYNGNENWAPGLKYGFFPSGAIGWNVSEEAFMKDNLPFIEFLKIKYSYGQIGSSPKLKEAERFTYIQKYNSGGSVTFGDGAQKTSYSPLYREGLPNNATNTWETAIKQNIGVELTVLQGRLHAEIDLFDEKRKDILMQRNNTIPAWYGNVAPYANIGETKNHGVDVSLKWNGTISNDFTYYLTGNFSMSENRIVKRDDPPGREEYRKQEGKPIKYITGRLINDTFNNWDDVYNATSPLTTSTVVRPGDFRYVDYNADGVIDNDDHVPIGFPSYAASSYAFSVGVTYKNLSLYGMFNGVFNISKQVSERYLWNDNEVLTPDELDYWTPENLDATTPSPSLIPQYNKARSTYSIRPSDFLRLRNVELKYNLGKSVLSRLRFINKLEVYLNGQNLITWSSLPKAFDPEAKELEAYPITRKYNLGLRFSF